MKHTAKAKLWWIELDGHIVRDYQAGYLLSRVCVSKIAVVDGLSEQDHIAGAALSDILIARGDKGSILEPGVK